MRKWREREENRPTYLSVSKSAVIFPPFTFRAELTVSPFSSFVVVCWASCVASIEVEMNQFERDNFIPFILYGT